MCRPQKSSCKPTTICCMRLAFHLHRMPHLQMSDGSCLCTCTGPLRTHAMLGGPERRARTALYKSERPTLTPATRNSLGSDIVEAFGPARIRELNDSTGNRLEMPPKHKAVPKLIETYAHRLVSPRCSLAVVYMSGQRNKEQPMTRGATGLPSTAR